MRILNSVLTALLVISAISCNFLNSTPSYKLTTNVVPEEGGTIIPGDDTFDKGTRIDITAEPNENWLFVRWEGDLGGVSSTMPLSFNSDKTITAVFTLRDYPLSIEIEGEGTVSEMIVEEKTTADYEYGTTVQLTAVPEEGWHFVRWEGDLEGSDNPMTITVDDEKVVKAVFEINEYSLNVTIVGEGQVAFEPEKERYLHGEEVTLTAVPGERWRFEGWTGHATGSTPAYVFVVGEDNRDIIATFAPLELPLWGMGYNFNGQLGDGTQVDRHEPTWSIFDVDKVIAGSWHSMFIKGDGTLWGMGYNFHGQLGDGTRVDRHSPVEVASGVTDVAGGEKHSIYVTSDGVLYATGANSEGQLGDGTTSQRESPVEIDTDVKSVAVGEEHSLYVKNDGTLWGMGRNTDNQLSSDTVSAQLTPVQIDVDVKDVAAGIKHTLYIKTDGTLWARGGNAAGQLGDGSMTKRTESVQVASDVIFVAAGRDHSMFITSDGTMHGMGNNTAGQLGFGAVNTSILEPTVIDMNVVSADGGNRHSLYVKADGTLWAMGKNDNGQLGDGTTEARLVPVQIDTQVLGVAAGVFHSLYVKQ